MAWRLTFRYDGERIELVKRQRVQMIAPPAIGRAPDADRDEGTWLELRDPGEKILYFKDIRRLMRAEVDVHSPDGKIRHVVGTPGQGTFDVVVPDAPPASAVAVMSTPMDAREARQKAREIARFPLDRGDAEPGR
jgi:hypothetical protein